MDQVIDILFPRRCPVCGEIVTPKGHLACAECKKKLSFVKPPRCKCCGKEVSTVEKEYCMDCANHKHDYTAGFALLNFDDAARQSIARFKYKNKREYARFYIEELLHKYSRQLLAMNADVLIPVPLHPSKLRRRGFNQAQLLAEGIGESLGIPVNNKVLFRIKKTLPQKQLNDSERSRNLKGAFGAKSLSPDLKSVILVDDIYTTGSTIDACAKILKQAGAKKVYYIAVCIGQGF